MKAGSWLILGGGTLCVTALIAWLKSENTKDAIKNAVEGKVSNDVPQAPGTLTKPFPTAKVHLTGYWPFVEGLSVAARKMEGAPVDRKGAALHTLEDFQAGRAPFVSVAGDYTIWPYGQKISLSCWPGVVFRVVDTGGHFHGPNKIYRVVGEEPLDICVASSNTVVPKKDVVATIYPSDSFEGSKAVATAGFRDQTVVVGEPEEYYASAEGNGDE